MVKVGPINLSPVKQVGIVVKDIEKTAEFYTSTFGIGPFSIHEVSLDGVIFRGQPITLNMKVAFAQSGPLQIELIQPVKGENLYTEFLAAKGEGLHHLAFEVDDMAATLAQMADFGIEPVFHHDLGFTAFAYLDTDKIGGLTIELLWNKKQDKTK